MKVIIAGSRSIDDYETVLKAIESSGFSVSEVVSGGARGVDLQGETYAKQYSLPCKRFIPTWNNPDGTLNRAAGIKRNMQMAFYADALIAIWDGKSKGTEHMINFMKKQNKPVFVHAI